MFTCQVWEAAAPFAMGKLHRLLGVLQHLLQTADVDGFKLLELIGLELDLPVISKSSPALHLLFNHFPSCSAQERNVMCYVVMSSNGETNVVLRGVTHGAVDFLIKPVRIEELRNVWQHVVRRKRDQVRICPSFTCRVASKHGSISCPYQHLANPMSRCCTTAQKAKCQIRSAQVRTGAWEWCRQEMGGRALMRRVMKLLEA